MEEQYERLFDLIASKSFGELTEEERTFILENLTEDEYTLQRKVIAAASSLEYVEESPLPLQIPQTKKHFLNRSVPMYQVLAGAACLLLLFLVGNRKTVSLNWQFPEYPLEISFANGATSGKFIRDTIIKEVPVIRPATSVIRDTVILVEKVLQQPEKRMLEVRNTVVYPELTEKLLESNSSSFKEDQATRFLPSNPVVNTFK